MTLKTYIWGMRIMTVLSVSALVAIVVYVNPEKAGAVEKSFFYLVFFFAFSGLFNLFLLFVRRYALGQEAAVATIGLSFRQGALLAILGVILLGLQSFRMLVWWDGLLAVAGVFLIELYFLSRS